MCHRALSHVIAVCDDFRMQKCHRNPQDHQTVRAVLRGVYDQIGDQEVAGSNPVAPTETRPKQSIVKTFSPWLGCGFLSHRRVFITHAKSLAVLPSRFGPQIQQSDMLL